MPRGSALGHLLFSSGGLRPAVGALRTWDGLHGASRGSWAAEAALLGEVSKRALIPPDQLGGRADGGPVATEGRRRFKASSAAVGAEVRHAWLEWFGQLGKVLVHGDTRQAAAAVKDRHLPGGGK